MKISNNALNFLLAQYRAIFKRAYIKGIASAVLLTAGLAAGQAQADNLTNTNLPDTNETATIIGDPNATAPNYNFIQLSGSASDFNGTVDVTAGYALESGSGSQNVIVGVDASGTSITGTGTLNISINNAELEGSGQGVLVLGNSGSVSLDIGAINVNEGVLRLSSSGSSGSGTVTVAAGTINVGTEGATGKQALLSLSDSGSDAGVTLGRVASGSITGSEISVLGGGLLTMQGSGSSGAEVVGNSLRIATGGAMLTDTGSVNKVLVDDFTIENGAFKVISGTDTVSETFQGHTATVQSGGNFLVGQSGTWTIDDTTEKDDDGKDITTQVTFKNGSNVQIDGNIVVSGGLLTIESGAGLHATTAAGTGLSGTITVAEKATGQGLEIDSSVLKSFLTAKDTYHDITTDASGAYITAESGSEDVAGSVVLKDGRLTFSDQTQVELSNFFFASGDGTSGSANTIVVSGSGSVIGGHDISIAKALKKAKDTDSDITGLHVTTDFLTLGDGTDTGLTKLSDSKVTKFTIRDGLNVNVKNNGFFTFDGAVEGVSFINSDPNWTAEVNGNLEFTSSQRTPIKGQWVFNDDVKLTNTGDANNTLNIGPWNGNGTPANADKISYNTDVVFKGQIINNAANGGYVGILAQTNGLEGVETTVDFTQATLSSPNADSAGLLSLQAYDDAVMKFNGNQFSQILSSSKTNGSGDDADGFSLLAGRGGTIEITSPVTGEYDFAKFHAKQSGQTDGKYYEQQVTFDGAGVLDINGDLGLYTGDKNNDSVSGAALNIGEGTIKANQISLTNYHVTDSKKGTYEAVTLQSGTLEVSQGLTVKLSDTLNVGAGSTDVANIVLESDTLTGTGTLAVEKDVNLNGEGSIKVVQGAWSTTANIYTKDSGSLVLENTTEGYDADELAENAYGASFVGKNFNSNTAGVAIEAHDGTKATFDTMQLANDSVVDLNDGHLLVNGANVTVAEGDKKTDKPFYVNLDANNTSTTAGIAFGDADIFVKGAQGVMEFGELATSKLLSLSGDTFTLVKGGIDDANFHVDDFGQLKFNFAENTKLNTKQISSLVNAVKVGDKNDTGYINLGNADLGLNFKDQENGTTTIAWSDLEDYVNVIGSAATSEKLMSAQVTDIAYTDKVKGHYGALSVVTTNNSLALNGPTSLHNAADFGNNFAVNQNTGELIALRLENGADLNLANGGNVGAIEGGFDNDVIISNDADVAGPTTTTVDGGITRVDLLQVGGANDLIVKGNVAEELAVPKATIIASAIAE